MTALPGDQLVPLTFQAVPSSGQENTTKTIKSLEPERRVRERDSVGDAFVVAMMKRNHTQLCASAAIAAALALSSTPLLAQFTEAPISAAPAPVQVIPETWSPPPPQAATVLPTELPETTPPPAIVTTPEPAPVRTTTTTTTTRTTRTVAPAPVARTPVAAPADPAPVSIDEDLTSVPTEAIAEPANEITVSEPFADEAPADNDNAFQFGLIALAAIAAFVLAIWGFIAIGRRKPADRKAATPVIERPVVAREPRHAPLIVEPDYLATPLSAVGAAFATPAPSMAHSGAAVPLPRKLPETFAERDALLKRMIAAQPDRANPFVTKKARMKRARLILQSLGSEFADRKPWIDLSQYPGNWPELSRTDTAAA